MNGTFTGAHTKEVFKLLEVKDIQKLFSYIKELHPHCPADKVPKLTNSVANLWIRTLSGYSMEQLFRAADDHARTCRFWPSLAEITAQLPSMSESERMRYAGPGAVERASMERMREWQEDWHKELAEHGLPTMREALEQGLTLKEWIQMLDQSGV